MSTNMHLQMKEQGAFVKPMVDSSNFSMLYCARINTALSQSMITASNIDVSRKKINE
jgi:hypothetical protein